MRKLSLYVAALAALALAPLSAQAQTISRGQTGAVGSIVTCADASGVTSQCVLPMAILAGSTGTEKGTAGNPLVTTPATGATSTVKIDQTTPGTTNGVVPAGNVASGATDSGNPVKTACKVNTTTPTFTDGQRADCQADTRGNLRTTIYVPDTQTSPWNNAGSDFAPSLTGLWANSRVFLFDGTNAARGITCPNSAVVNVTAAATTQIVAISASTQVRVCSIALTMSAAGTAKFLYGTGSNCGTGPVDLTGAFTLATGTPLQLSAPSGGTLFRGAAANALCVAAVTGNVTGFITYAQF